MNILSKNPGDFSAYTSLSHTDVSQSKVAPIVMGLLLFGIFFDYTGNFGVKYTLFIVALLWVLQYKKSRNILKSRFADIVVLLILPISICLFHLFRLIFFSPENFNLTYYLIRSYRTITSPALIILYPLFRCVGSERILRQMSIGFQIIAVIVITTYILHILGIIDILDFNEFLMRHEMGSFGGDQRLGEALIDARQKVVISPTIAYPMILILGYELIRSPIAAILVVLTILIIGSRGLVIGCIIMILSVLFLTKQKSLKTSLKKYGFFFLILFSIIYFSEPISFRISGVFFERSRQMVNIEDLSTQHRVGHIEGYMNLIEDNITSLIWGEGPTGEIYNTFAGYYTYVTEISILNTALYYGIPYAVLFLFLLYYSAFKLWQKRYDIHFRKEDIGLITGATVYWLVGNTNPQMNSPFSIMAFMLLILRTWEIRQLNYVRER